MASSTTSVRTKPLLSRAVVIIPDKAGTSAQEIPLSYRQGMARYGLRISAYALGLLGGRMIMTENGTPFIAVSDRGIVSMCCECETAAGSQAGQAGLAASTNGRLLRVLLADDHAVIRKGLALLLSTEYAIEVVGEATNGLEAVDLASQLLPDIVIMDVSMPGLDGEQATRRIKQDLPEIRVIGLSMWEEPAMRERMCRAGAERYLLKTASAEELLAAVRG